MAAEHSSAILFFFFTEFLSKNKTFHKAIIRINLKLVFMHSNN